MTVQPGTPEAQALEVYAEPLPWLIDGRLGSASPRDAIDVLDPASGDLVGRAPVARDVDVDAAVEAAGRAFPGWAADGAERRRRMHAAADTVDAHAEELASLLTREQGKPLSEARREIGRFALWLRHYAAVEVEEEIVRDDGDRLVRVQRRPLGVVATITPWNFPISLLGWKVAPALAVGNTVVARPSSQTPLTTLRLGALLRDAFPPGVLNVVSGRSASASRLVGHLSVRKIAFTGSTATGREIMRLAGPDLKRVTLELGGNDAAIVLDDVDVESVVERLFWSAFTNCGQVCIAVKRLFVPATLHDAIVDALAERARATRLGHGLQPGTEIGPLNNEAQRRRVEDLVSAARASGADIVVGGRRPERVGSFYEPTIVSGIGPGQPLVDEEQFGPVLPVIAYADVDEAVTAANATDFGLGASVWTSDPARADAIADRLDVGTVWINQHQEALPEAPFGGARDSGLGYENGLPGLEAYVQLQTRNERRR
jgi:acyl-CoA reductase-like NAD-dependent aldehyde dehydrogenase